MAGSMPVAYGNIPVQTAIAANAAGDQVRRDTFFFGWDTIGYAPASTLTKADLFIYANKPTEYQSLVFPLQSGQAITITELTATHNIVGATSGLELADQMRFEQDSYLLITVKDKVYPKIPLSAILPYTVVRKGTGYDIVPNLGRWMGLKDLIVVSDTSSIKIEFYPAPIALPASGASTPLAPGLLSSGSACHWISFKVAGRYQS